MRISIVVPAFNEEKLIAETLRHIRQAMDAFSSSNWPSELIVCDNNSTDRTGELARAAGAKVVFEPVNQIARSRNAGAAAASGDWLIFVDADSHPTRELFGDVAKAIASGRCLAGGCTLKLEGPYAFGSLVMRCGTASAGSRSMPQARLSFAKLRLFGRSAVSVSGFFASEEIDLSKRLKKLARERGKRMVILHRYPMVTSARKLHLYSGREHLRFLARTILGFGRTLTDRDACHTWYDGRR